MENIWLRFQAPKCVKHIQKQCNSRYITINNTPAKTSRRTGNRARENRVLQKKKCFPSARQPLLPLEKWEIWTSKFGCFLGKWCFRYSKRLFSCLFRLDKCRHLFHSIFRSICAVFSSSFLYLLIISTHISLSLYLSIYLSICLSVCLFVCLSVCLSKYIYIILTNYALYDYIYM